MPNMVKALLLCGLALAWFSEPAGAASLSVLDLDVSSALLTVGLKCDLKNGRLVCGDKSGHKKSSHKEDGDGDHHEKKKNKSQKSETTQGGGGSTGSGTTAKPDDINSQSAGSATTNS